MTGSIWAVGARRFAALLACTPPMEAPLAQAGCGAVTDVVLQNDDGPVRVGRLGEGLAFTSGLKVNTDGAANSYHPIGKSKGALNTVCNGLAVYPAAGKWKGVRVSGKYPKGLSGGERCQLILDTFRASRDNDWAIPAMGRIDWFAIAHEREERGRYRPCIQSEGRFAGFFVARTASAADAMRGECDPRRWISSTEVPYVTLPGERLADLGVRPGALALVHRRLGDQDVLVAAVAADVGNAAETGEGSIALHAALGNEPGGTGKLPENIRNGITTLIFPKVMAERPISATSIAAKRDDLIRRLGGTEALERCLRSAR